MALSPYVRRRPEKGRLCHLWRSAWSVSKSGARLRESRDAWNSNHIQQTRRCLARRLRQRSDIIAAITDYANEAAALSAGWKKLQIDRGAAFTERYVTHLEKWATGAGQGGSRLVATGTSTVSAAAADTAALSACNAQRRHRYGGSPGRASGDGDSIDSRGSAHSIDTT
jgi:hypothetical protein